MENLTNISMTYKIIALVLLAAVISFYFFVSFHKKRKVYSIEKKAQSYVAGLNELIAGNNSRAIELFKEAVRFDTNNIDAYIKLGMLYRLERKPEQALKIHKELTIRSGLNKIQIIEIYSNIIQGLLDLEDFHDALEYCEKILSIEPKNQWALNMIPLIYEKQEDWKNAFKSLKSSSVKNKEIDHKIAVYKVAYGKSLIDKEEYHDARLILKEAIKLDRTYPPAYLYLGDAYARQDKRDGAVQVWREFAEEAPQKSYMVFEYLDRAYFEAGNYGAMEVFLTKIIEKDPDNYHALVRLGEIYFKKGEKEKAFEMTERSMKVNPQSPEALSNLIMYLNNTSDLQVIKEKAISLAKLVSEPTTFVCRECDHKSSEILIRCPSCKNLDTFGF